MSVSKDKKRGTWLYHGYYREVTGKRTQYCHRGFATKREAKEAESAFLLSAARVRTDITLDELVQLYHHDFPALGIKEATLISNEGYYNIHIKPSLGAAKLSSLTAPVVTQFMTEASKKTQPGGKPYSVATINKIKEVLSKYLTYAVRLGYLEYNACHAVPRFKRPGDIPKQSENFWEVSTFQYFISCVDDPNWIDVFTFLFGTGLRSGEFMALQWSDVDLGAGILRVNKTITHKTREHGWKLTSPKTARSVRRIDLQEPLVALLRNRYEQESKKEGFCSSYFIFGDITPMSRQVLADHLKYYIKKSGVPSITPHGFRHSHASFLIRSGKIDDQLIADRLGHTVEEMRKTYAHIYEEARGDLKSVLNELF